MIEYDDNFTMDEVPSGPMTIERDVYLNRHKYIEILTLYSKRFKKKSSLHLFPLGTGDGSVEKSTHCTSMKTKVQIPGTV